MLDAARKMDYLLQLEVYCDGDCPARQMRITVKDHDRTLIESVRNHGLKCPLCGSALALHGVMTRAEEGAQSRRLARCSTNSQMFERDQMAQGAELVAVPIAVFMDDRLPPTPPEWWKGKAGVF